MRFSAPSCTGLARSSMLTELIVKQFALMEQMHLQLGSGMTVFSGETGAGKSILVDALGAAFGARASSEWVRFGAERAEVTAVLEGVGEGVQSLLAGQDMDGGDQLILRRVINADGRSRAYINGVPVPLKALQQIGNACLDLHGQHEHQALMHSDFQRQIVDARIAGALLQSVQAAYQQWKQEQKKLDQILTAHEETVRNEAWLREEHGRLQALEIEPGIEPRLQSLVETGRHFAQIQEAAATGIAALEDGDTNVRSLLAQVEKSLDQVVGYRQDLDESLELLKQMDALLGELVPDLRSVLDEAVDPQELAQAEERLMDLHDAMRRHQVDEAGLIALIEDMGKKVQGLDTAAWDADEQQRNLEEVRRQYQAGAKQLSRARQESAQALVGDMRPYLDQLALQGMQVEIEVRAFAEDDMHWSEHGWDEVQFMAASNPGEPFRPLASIASGGEMSRLVLALKGCGALQTAPDIAVFDEVDAGIGGETAWHVGGLLAAMGKDRQVLVVSHLPQVAACADHQARISKHQQDERTLTFIESVEADNRRDEIARMLGGANVKSREHAAQMLQRGQMAHASS